MIDLKDNDPVFYYRINDWRKETKQCTFKEWEEDSGDKKELDIPEDEYENIVLMFRQFSEKNVKFFSVILKENDNKQIMISKDKFNPTIHLIAESASSLKKREDNTISMIKSGKAPGFNTTTVRTSTARGSMFHKNRLDEGAMGDLLDKGLEGAKARAEQREKKFGKGHAFNKRSYGRRIRNGKGKRH